jgi:outer membrane protein
MRKFLIAALFAILSTTTANAAPMQAKVVVVDIQAVLEGSTAAKDLKTQLEAKRKEYQKQISAKEEALKKSDAELVKQKAVLSAADLEKKKKSFVDEVEKVRKDVQNKRLSLDSAYKKAVGDIQSNVQKIIEEMATSQGFNIAIPTSQLIYAQKDMDITKDVTAKLNQRLPKVALKF